MNNFFKNGFIKRAKQRGLSTQEAEALLYKISNQMVPTMAPMTPPMQPPPPMPASPKVNLGMGKVFSNTHGIPESATTVSDPIATTAARG
jgi:hypothetical protein